MSGENLGKKSETPQVGVPVVVDNSVETLKELANLQIEAADNKDYNLCKIIQLEIQRCLHKKPLLIPAGQVEGLILDPLAVLLGK